MASRLRDAFLISVAFQNFYLCSLTNFRKIFIKTPLFHKKY